MTEKKLQKIIVIAGPTASGKSGLAMEICEKFDGEIINADSIQVYKYLDIGSAKPTKEDREKIPHHLIDIKDLTEPFSAADFKELADEAIKDITSRGKVPVIVGGTGLYIRALTEGLMEAPDGDEALREKFNKEIEEHGLDFLYDKLKKVDPVATEKIHRNNRHRIIRALEVYELTGKPLSEHQKAHGFKDKNYNALKIALEVDRDELRERIAKRTEEMYSGDAIIKEVQSILELGYKDDLKPLNSVGYREAAAKLKGAVSRDEALELTKKSTYQYAKRQVTWFKKEPNIKWFNVRAKADIMGEITEFLRS